MYNVTFAGTLYIDQSSLLRERERERERYREMCIAYIIHIYMYIRCVCMLLFFLFFFSSGSESIGPNQVGCIAHSYRLPQGESSLKKKERKKEEKKVEKSLEISCRRRGSRCVQQLAATANTKAKVLGKPTKNERTQRVISRKVFSRSNTCCLQKHVQQRRKRAKEKKKKGREENKN